MGVVPRRKALDIIRNEHRAIAAVLHCLSHILDEVRDESLEPPFDVFELAIRYLSEFSDRFHHPKEDDFLFPALSRRDPESRETLATLQKQHDEGRRLTEDLQAHLGTWKEHHPGGFRAFDKAAGEFIEFQWDHLKLEEGTIMPAAREKLTDEDWSAIDDAFNENEDPLFGANPKAAFDGLFRKIVAKAPAPWGLGAREEPKRETVLSRLGFWRN